MVFAWVLALKSGSVIHSSVGGGRSGGGLVGGVPGGQGAILAQEEVVFMVCSKLLMSKELFYSLDISPIRFGAAGWLFR